MCPDTYGSCYDAPAQSGKNFLNSLFQLVYKQ